jgi:hypothetical protein
MQYLELGYLTTTKASLEIGGHNCDERCIDKRKSLANILIGQLG